MKIKLGIFQGYNKGVVINNVLIPANQLLINENLKTHTRETKISYIGSSNKNPAFMPNPLGELLPDVPFNYPHYHNGSSLEGNTELIALLKEGDLILLGEVKDNYIIICKVVNL